MSQPGTDLLIQNPPWTPRADEAGARLLLVAGGRLGVGATTVAFQVARELAQDAQRIVLIDADLGRPTLASRCGIEAGLTISDVLSGRKTIHEALERGPAGMQVLGAAAGASLPTPLDDRSISRLTRQLSTLSPHADWLIADVGHQTTELAARLWSAAQQVLLVTAADAVAVMDTYSLLKTLQSRRAMGTRPALVVNQVDDPLVAADVHRRIDQSCRRFLGLSLAFAAAVPNDISAVPSDIAHDPSVTEPGQDRGGSLAASIAQLCKRLVDDPPPAVNPPLAA